MPAAMEATANIFRSGLGSPWPASTLRVVMEGFVGSMGSVGDGASMVKEFSEKRETSVFCFLTKRCVVHGS